MTARSTDTDHDPAAELASQRAATEAQKAALGGDVWRLRRLAELGAAQAKINHDLRNLLTAALMVADRLGESDDPKVSRSGAVLITAIEQATALIGTTLNFVAEPVPLLSISRFPLAALIEEVAGDLRPLHGDFAVENTAPADLYLQADRAQFARAIGHLLRSSAQAQAQRAVVHAEHQDAAIGIVLTDDGRPFRDGTAAAAFVPFSGAYRYGSTGLGLVIARDVIEAHGGTITIRGGSAQRTCIVLTLPAAR